MGHYTTLARFARMTPGHQRQRRPAHAGGRLHADACERPDAPADDAPYRCPECGEGSVADTECPRCEVAVYRRDAVFELPPAPSVAPRPRRGATRGALAAAGGLSFVALAIFGVVAQVRGTAPATNPFGTSRGAQDYVAYGVFLVLVVGAALAALFVAGTDAGGALRGLWSRRASTKRLRRRMRETRPSDLATLFDGSGVAESGAPLRVRGRVRVELRDGERQLVITDGDARCRVRVAEGLTAFDDEGPVTILEDGATVELLGVGERRLGAGEGYRDAHGEVELRASVAYVER